MKKVDRKKYDLSPSLEVAQANQRPRSPEPAGRKDQDHDARNDSLDRDQWRS